MPKKPEGNERKTPRSVRVEPSVLEAIEKLYGSLTGFVNTKIKNDRKVQKELNNEKSDKSFK